MSLALRHIATDVIENSAVSQGESVISDGCFCVSAVPVFEGDFLVVSQGMSLIKVPFDARGTPIYFRPLMTATSVDVDCFKAGLIFVHQVDNFKYNLKHFFKFSTICP